MGGREKNRNLCVIKSKSVLLVLTLQVLGKEKMFPISAAVIK